MLPCSLKVCETINNFFLLWLQEYANWLRINNKEPQKKDSIKDYINNTVLPYWKDKELDPLSRLFSVRCTLNIQLKDLKSRLDEQMLGTNKQLDKGIGEAVKNLSLQLHSLIDYFRGTFDPCVYELTENILLFTRKTEAPCFFIFDIDEKHKHSNDVMQWRQEILVQCQELINEYDKYYAVQGAEAVCEYDKKLTQILLCRKKQQNFTLQKLHLKLHPLTSSCRLCETPATINDILNNSAVMLNKKSFKQPYEVLLMLAEHRRSLVDKAEKKCTALFDFLNAFYNNQEYYSPAAFQGNPNLRDIDRFIFLVNSINLRDLIKPYWQEIPDQEVERRTALLKQTFAKVFETASFQKLICYMHQDAIYFIEKAIAAMLYSMPGIKIKIQLDQEFISFNSINPTKLLVKHSMLFKSYIFTSKAGNLRAYSVLADKAIHLIYEINCTPEEKLIIDNISLQVEDDHPIPAFRNMTVKALFLTALWSASKNYKMYEQDQEIPVHDLRPTITLIPEIKAAAINIKAFEDELVKKIVQWRHANIDLTVPEENNLIIGSLPNSLKRIKGLSDIIDLLTQAEALFSTTYSQMSRAKKPLLMEARDSPSTARIASAYHSLRQIQDEYFYELYLNIGLILPAAHQLVKDLYALRPLEQPDSKQHAKLIMLCHTVIVNCCNKPCKAFIKIIKQYKDNHLQAANLEGRKKLIEALSKCFAEQKASILNFFTELYKRKLIKAKASYSRDMIDTAITYLAKFSDQAFEPEQTLQFELTKWKMGQKLDQLVYAREPQRVIPTVGNIPESIKADMEFINSYKSQELYKLLVQFNQSFSSRADEARRIINNSYSSPYVFPYINLFNSVLTHALESFINEPHRSNCAHTTEYFSSSANNLEIYSVVFPAVGVLPADGEILECFIRTQLRNSATLSSNDYDSFLGETIWNSLHPYCLLDYLKYIPLAETISDIPYLYPYLTMQKSLVQLDRVNENNILITHTINFANIMSQGNIIHHFQDKLPAVKIVFHVQCAIVPGGWQLALKLHEGKIGVEFYNNEPKFALHNIKKHNGIKSFSEHFQIMVETLYNEKYTAAARALSSAPGLPHALSMAEARINEDGRLPSSPVLQREGSIFGLDRFSPHSLSTPPISPQANT